MADQSDVENALAALVANALYPNGTSAPSVNGTVYRVYRGAPASPVLDADLAQGAVHISVSANASRVRDATRYPRHWVSVKPVSAVLSVAVANVTATFLGTCAVGQLAGVVVNETAFPCAVQASDTPFTVASNLAALIRAAGWIVDYSGTSLTVPAATQFEARVVAGAGALQELRRQVQEFRVSLWCPDPALRDATAVVVDPAMIAANFIALADGSFGRVKYAGDQTTDAAADATVYRRDLIYSVEFPTTLNQQLAAMLFGTAAVQVNATLTGNFLS